MFFMIKTEKILVLKLSENKVLYGDLLLGDT